VSKTAEIGGVRRESRGGSVKRRRGPGVRKASGSDKRRLMHQRLPDPGWEREAGSGQLAGFAASIPDAVKPTVCRPEAGARARLRKRVESLSTNRNLTTMRGRHRRLPNWSIPALYAVVAVVAA